MPNSIFVLGTRAAVNNRHGHACIATARTTTGGALLGSRQYILPPDGGADGARKPRVPPEVPSPTELPAEAVEPPKQDDLDRKAAKVAVEMDSYKRAIFVEKPPMGSGALGPTEARPRSSSTTRTEDPWNS